MSPDGFTKPLPEERLLKLIRGKGAPPAATAIPAQAAAAGAAAAAPASPMSRRRLRALPWPRAATLVLGSLLVVELLSLVAEFTIPAPVIVVPKPLPVADASASASSAVAPEIPALAQSAAGALFTASPEATPGAAGGAHAPPSEAVQALASRLTLMGIIAGNPAQVIIEDSKSGKTYFLSVGQGTVDGAVLEEVQDHRVVLSVGGERVELSL